MSTRQELCLLCTLAVCTPCTTARTIDVAEHGILPGKDVCYQVNQLIDTIREESDVTLVFPKGQYDFYPENAMEVYRAVSNHDNGLKRLAFPLFDSKNITIDGRGSLFMFHGHMIPFTLERVEGATLKNFAIDWIRSFHDEMTVVSRDDADNSFVVALDPKTSPHTIRDGKIFFQRYLQEDAVGSNMVFDPATRSPIYNTRAYSVNARRMKVTPAGKNRARFETAVKKAPPIGSVLVTYGVHPTSRLCPAIHVTNSKNVRIENVTVYDAGGMGLIVERTENVTVNRMTVTSAKDRLVSTRADATHFIGCKGTIRLDDCCFEHMLDDGINVHGAYVKVEDSLGQNQFLCEISHFQQWGLIFAEPGDRVALLSRKTVLPFYETTVQTIRILNEHRFVMTVAEVPTPMPKGPLSVENLTWYPDLVMRRNKIRDNRARSVLVTTKGKVLIEDNLFSSQMHGILIEGDNNKWYESGAVQDVTIRHNTFDNMGYAVTKRYPLLASPLFTSDQHMGEGQYHRNISFTHNTIKSFNGLLVKARSVKGLSITDNTLAFSTFYPKVDEGPAIVLEYCDEVRIKGNTAIGFDRPMPITPSSDTTHVMTQQNKGFKRDLRPKDD